MFCTVCGAENPDGNNFCISCGAKLTRPASVVVNQKEDKLRYSNLYLGDASLQGLEDMTMSELRREVARGGRFVQYTYTVSIIVMTFKNPSDIFFLRAGESGHGLKYGLINFLFGWWGIPWGPIYTLGCTFKSTAGEDLTAAIMSKLEEVNV